MSDLEIQRVIEALKAQQEKLMHEFNSLRKAIDDVLWYKKVGDVAQVDKVRITGPPSRYLPNPTAQGAGNPIIFWAYTFTPMKVNANEKHPLIVLPHGGVHANMDSSYAHIIRELVQQGYIVIAPEYRGSTGYGEKFFHLIDYGGLEIEDTYAARNWIVENNRLVDSKRVGLMGWSHGGLHVLLNIFTHPEAYQACYAGVPVSDLVARMGYKTDNYRKTFSAESHIGKTAYENVNEYRRRSPAWNAEKLQTPLLIHTNTNDASVNVLEVEHLIKSLKAVGKDFEYEIYQDVPGGHNFDRIDTKHAREARLKIYKFLAKYLKPPAPLKRL